MEREGVLVVGSSNMDLVVAAERFPLPGETILGSRFNMFPGGKGANQAVCCAKLGCKTYFITKFGNDEFKDKLFNTMTGDGVNVQNLLTDDKEHTGIAFITVDSKGQNEIIVIPGSNMNLNPSEIEERYLVFSQVKVVLTQLEIPIETVEKAAQLARKAECLFILNPAPATKLPESLFGLIDFLTPNETELQHLTGMNVSDEAAVESAARKLLDKGVKNVIVTLGEKGALLVNNKKCERYPVNRVNVIDSTAAGDAFNGAFAFSVAQGSQISDSIRFANKVASMSVTRMGAQSSMPLLSEVEWNLSV